MSNRCLHEPSDRHLAKYLLEAEKRSVEYRNLVGECKFHQMLRKHVKREHLKDQAALIAKQISQLGV